MSICFKTFKSSRA